MKTVLGGADEEGESLEGAIGEEWHKPWGEKAGRRKGIGVPLLASMEMEFLRAAGTLHGRQTQPL